MVYRLTVPRASVPELAAPARRASRRSTGSLFREGAEAVLLRARRGAPLPAGRGRRLGDIGRRRRCSVSPNGFERALGGAREPERGRGARLAAAEGYEFADIGGRHHAGGGSHGSLVAGDSEVPMLTVGARAAAGAHRRHRAARCRASASRPLRPPVSPDVALTARRAMVAAAAAHAATSTDERVLAAMERVPRELFLPAASCANTPTTTPRCRSAGRPDDLAAVHRRAHRRDARAARRRAGARRRHGLRLPGRGPCRARRARSSRSSASPSSPRRRGRTSARRGLRRVHVMSATHAGVPGQAPFDAIAVAAAAPSCPRRSTSSWSARPDRRPARRPHRAAPLPGGPYARGARGACARSPSGSCR